MYGAWRLICLRQCFADFYYLPQESSEFNGKLPDFNTKLPSCFTRVSDVFQYFLSCHEKFIGETINCTPRACIDDGFTDLLVNFKVLMPDYARPSKWKMQSDEIAT
jgi:hypothetical protein